MAAKRMAAEFVAVRGGSCRTLSASRHTPIKLERKVALCAASKIGRPLPGEMLLHDKLPTFHASTRRERREEFETCVCRFRYKKSTSIPMPSKFIYNALQPGKRTIRLIRLHSTVSENQQPQCDLFNADIADNGTVPYMYESLSYTWGSNIKSHTILVNGDALRITANLYDALQSIQRWKGRPLAEALRARQSVSKTSAALWVDAICIDQENIQERGDQVQLMGHIYRNASQVIIWLGKSNQNVDAFMDFVAPRKWCIVPSSDAYRKLHRGSHEKPLDGVDTAPPEEPEESHGRSLEGLDPAPYGVHEVLDEAFDKDSNEELDHDLLELGYVSFISRSWFMRVWIVQELLLAIKPVFACGDRFVDASNFAESPDRDQVYYPSLGTTEMEVAKLVPDYAVRTQLLSLSSLLFRNHSLAYPCDLFGILKAFNGRETTDPRDLIYGMLGMVIYPENVQPLEVDYSNDEIAVVQSVVKWAFGDDILDYWPAEDLPSSIRDFLQDLESISKWIFREMFERQSDSHINHFVERVPNQCFEIYHDDVRGWQQQEDMGSKFFLSISKFHIYKLSDVVYGARDTPYSLVFYMIEHYDTDVVKSVLKSAARQLEDYQSLDGKFTHHGAMARYFSEFSLIASMENGINPVGVAQLVSNFIQSEFPEDRRRWNSDYRGSTDIEIQTYVSQDLVDAAFNNVYYAVMLLNLLEPHCYTKEELQRVNEAKIELLSFV